jgi:hypothetical protein
MNNSHGHCVVDVLCPDACSETCVSQPVNRARSKRIQTVSFELQAGPGPCHKAHRVRWLAAQSKRPPNAIE